MDDQCQSNDPDAGRPGDARRDAIGGSISVEEIRLDAPTPGNALARFSRRREEMRFFLVACHQASVSVETMSTYLGLDAGTIRSELLLGIDAWNVAQRRTNEPAFMAHRMLDATRN